MNVTQIDIEFVNLTSTTLDESIRVAAEFVLVANESATKPFAITERKTVDDEHTPGTFRLIDIISPGASNGTQGNILIL